MKTAKIAEAKNNLSKYLAYVRRGGRVRILDRDTAIADLVPIPRRTDTGGSGELESLEQEGIVRRGSQTPLPEEFFEPGPPDSKGALVRLLMEERKKGR